MHRSFCRLNRIMLIVNGRCRTREIVNLIYLDIKRESHVMPHEFEVRVVQQAQNILFTAGIQVVNTENIVPLVDQAPAEMRPKETGPAGHQHPLRDQPLSQVFFIFLNSGHNDQ